MSMHLSAVTPSVLHPPSLGPLPAPPTPTWAVGRTRSGIFKLLRSLGIDSNVAPPAYVAWWAGTITLIPTGFLAPIDCLKIPQQEKAEKERMNGDVVKTNRTNIHR
jgi:hypothetical protein